MVAKADEESLAVMFVLEGAHEGGYSVHSLFLRLPRVLRNRWSERYLADEVLKDLVDGGKVSSERVDRTVHYELSLAGRAALL